MNSTVADRLASLEERVAKLESLAGSPVPNAEDLADLDGAVTFGGSVTVGRHSAEYRWTRPTHWITDNDWSEQIERVAALAHPVRGEILRHVLGNPATAAELVEAEVVSSTGTAYHHLNALQAAGWLTKAGGAYSVPAARIIPLMTIMTAAEAH